MNRRSILAHILVPVGALALLAAACGGGGSSAKPSTPAVKAAASPAVLGQPISGPLPCNPAGSALTIVAKGSAFTTKCLATSANHPFTIELVNHSPVLGGGVAPLDHNVGIYSSRAFTHEVFSGQPYVHPTKTGTYDVPALARGLYFFRCDLHPWMKGTFVVA